jgi:hypothetical protein
MRPFELFRSSNHNETTDPEPQSQNKWEQMAENADLTKEYSRLLTLNPENLSEEECSRIISFSQRLISNSYGKKIAKERLEKLTEGVRILDRKQYREEISKSLTGEEQFFAILADGFHHQELDITFIRNGGRKIEALIATTIHEMLHSACDQTELQPYERDLNEGITELFTSRLLSQVGNHKSDHYEEEQEFAKDIEVIVSPEMLEDAYFRGDYSRLSEKFAPGDFEEILKDSEEYFESLSVFGGDDEKEEKHQRLCSRITKYKNQLNQASN